MKKITKEIIINFMNETDFMSYCIGTGYLPVTKTNLYDKMSDYISNSTLSYTFLLVEVPTILESDYITPSMDNDYNDASKKDDMVDDAISSSRLLYERIYKFLHK